MIPKVTPQAAAWLYLSQTTFELAVFRSLPSEESVSQKDLKAQVSYELATPVTTVDLSNALKVLVMYELVTELSSTRVALTKYGREMQAMVRKLPTEIQDTRPSRRACVIGVCIVVSLIAILYGVFRIPLLAWMLTISPFLSTLISVIILRTYRRARLLSSMTFFYALLWDGREFTVDEITRVIKADKQFRVLHKREVKGALDRLAKTNLITGRNNADWDGEAAPYTYYYQVV